MSRTAKSALIGISLAAVVLLLGGLVTRGETTVNRSLDRTYRGTITAIDLQKDTVTVRMVFIRHTFNLLPNAKITLEGNVEASPTALKVGDTVMLRYYRDGKQLLAREISVLPPPKPRLTPMYPPYAPFGY